MKNQTRRSFLKTAVRGGVGLAILPNIMPRSLFAADLPSRRIHVAQIGCGREGREDMSGIMAYPAGRIVAVCDLDSKRLAAGKKLAEDFYQKRGESNVDVKSFHDYHEVLARPDIDAVVVTVPDHWHALVAIEAAIAGKHLYVQKPVTYNIAEAIALRTAVIMQTGSQQRSEHPWMSFRTASEAVRNGRIGKLQTIKIGIGLDKPSGHAPAPMPVPENLDYERWLGPAPEQPYMEGRVHPQDSFTGRPGWITTEDFGLGMITAFIRIEGRPVGVIQGIAGSFNPFSIRPSYLPLEQLSPRERLQRMRDPELRRRLLAEEPSERQLARLSQARQAMISAPSTS